MGTKEFRLPDLGEGLEDAEVVRWLVEEGAAVSLNQPIVEVDTAKALVEIPSPVAGTVSKLHASAGEVVKVGAVLVSFEVEGEEGSRTAVLVGYGVHEGAQVKRRRRLGAAKRAHEAAAEESMQQPATAVLAAPPVRKLAAELGVDLSTVSGSGPGGRITRDDVQAAAGGGAPELAEVQSEDVERVAVRGTRRLIAERMSESAREIPHVTTFLTFDASGVNAKRDKAGLKSPLAIVAHGLVSLCSKHPKLNASFDAKASEIVLHRKVHLGVATDTERGLVVPVVRNAESMSVQELSEEIGRLASLARGGKASPADLSGSTITISNVGSFGAEFGTPIINYPESAILALGTIEDRPWVVDGSVQVRPVVTLSLSFDHRLIDGAEAGTALNDLKALLTG